MNGNYIDFVFIQNFIRLFFVAVKKILKDSFVCDKYDKD